ncbi:Phospholipid scramblase 1 [Myotis davidii]|uniref:Phospholipid scramblase n=1 Tax=Myotis davidii TaxID=225400 RepID=L5MC87_MYODS|nr:Phospholipid scramblase 1 [Myotis davidii]
MNAPHPGTNFPAGYHPQYPPAAFQGPPGHTGYPGLQAAYPGMLAGYPVPQTDYSVPPPGWSSAGPVGFPVQHQPVYNQPVGPAGVPWMPAPPPPSDCPRGLEYLSQIDQILIHQQVELLEVLTGFETNNKYEIKNSLGQRIYFVTEDNNCCTRNTCGAHRPFTMRILDLMGQEVITLERPLRCTSCCCPCCLQEVRPARGTGKPRMSAAQLMPKVQASLGCRLPSLPGLPEAQIEIYAPSGVPVGYVIQNWHPCLPKLTIQNERREDVLKIIGPCLVCGCCADVDFEIKSLDEENVVGKISKQWTGFVREAFTDTDNFGIQFPLDLDVKMKAVMLGACFLILQLHM